MEFNQPVRLSGARRMLSDGSAHLDKRNGTRQQAITYCTKTETRVDGPWYNGSCQPGHGGQGERSDLKSVARAVKEDGLSAAIDQYPSQYIKFHRGMEKLAEHYQPEPPAWRSVEVIILCGKPGVGKSRWCWETFPGLYKVEKPANRGTLWFNGYTDQDVILIDDFRGWISYSQMLHICDGYKLQMQTKGGHTWGRWTKVLITSNKDPSEWWKSVTDQSAFQRRVTEIRRFDD